MGRPIVKKVNQGRIKEIIKRIGKIFLAWLLIGKVVSVMGSGVIGDVIGVRFQLIPTDWNHAFKTPAHPAQFAPSNAIPAMPEAKYSPAGRQSAMRQWRSRVEGKLGSE